jgi:hypothetical protein
MVPPKAVASARQARNAAWDFYTLLPTAFKSNYQLQELVDSRSIAAAVTIITE